MDLLCLAFLGLGESKHFHWALSLGHSSRPNSHHGWSETQGHLDLKWSTQPSQCCHQCTSATVLHWATQCMFRSSWMIVYSALSHFKLFSNYQKIHNGPCTEICEFCQSILASWCPSPCHTSRHPSSAAYPTGTSCASGKHLPGSWKLDCKQFLTFPTFLQCFCWTWHKTLWYIEPLICLHIPTASWNQLLVTRCVWWVVFKVL